MRGSELRKWRESQGLSQRELAGMVGYSVTSVSGWERDLRTMPEDVVEFLQDGGRAEPEATFEGDAATSPEASPASGGSDDVPPLAPVKPLGLAITGDRALAKACEELWDMFGFTLTASGALLSRPALANDGKIISGWPPGVDSQGRKFEGSQGMKRELGEAYGKLAERNKTFQRIVLALSQETVWGEVCIVTSKLAIEMYKNHQRYAVVELQQRQAQSEAAEPQAA